MGAVLEKVNQHLLSKEVQTSRRVHVVFFTLLCDFHFCQNQVEEIKPYSLEKQ